MMIKSDTLRIYKSVHTWAGILSGMALFIAFYAGALTVFKEPLMQWASPPAHNNIVPLEDASALITKTLAANPAAGKDFSLYLDPVDNAPGRITWRVRHPKADDHDDSASRNYTAYLDSQGDAVTEEITPSSLGTLIDTLHRVVGLPIDDAPSRWFMGVISALYAIALFSGVVVLLPTLVSDFFALRIGKNLKRMWLDAHNVVGIVSLPFHIIMAVTAVVFAFHDQIYDVQDKLVHDGKWSTAFQRSKPPAGATPPRDPAAMRSPAELVAIAHTISPGFVPYQIQYQQVTGARPAARIWGKDATAIQPRARGGFIAVDPYSGKVTSTDFMPGNQQGPSLLISSFFSLHMAAFGGTLVQWMYFLLGLAGAWLFYSGNLLWIESRRRRAARGNPALPEQRLDTRLMAAATVGVCLGSVCGLSLTIVGARWLSGHVADLNSWHTKLYYAAFFLALAWSFTKGAARASAHLLWSAALLCLSLPVTSLLAAWVPGLGLWTSNSPGAMGVDATAFVMSVGFAWMARSAMRRAKAGARDSVWSAAPHNREAMRDAKMHTEN